MLVSLPPYRSILGTFIPPASGIDDPLWDKVVLLMHMNDGQFTDLKGNPVILQGVTLDTTKKKFGAGSMKFDYNYNTGVMQWFEIPTTSQFNLGMEFCIELFLALTETFRDGQIILSRWGIGPNQAVDWIFLVHPNGAVQSVCGGVDSTSPAGTIPFDGQFHHVAIDRYAGVISVYVDGVRKHQFANANAINAGQARNVRTRMDTFHGMKGWYDELRVTNGASRYRGADTYPVPGEEFASQQFDTYFRRNTLLLSGEELLDLTGKNTFTGTAPVSTAQKKFGANSLSFNGGTDFLKSVTAETLNFGISDYTVELWAYVQNTGDYQTLIGNRASNATAYVGDFDLVIPADGTIGIFGEGGYLLRSATAFIANNQWYHLAAVRLNGTTRIYVNGVEAVATNTVRAYNSTAPIAIGANQNGTEKFKGYIDGLRVTKGVARYTAPFTPGNAPFTTLYPAGGDEFIDKTPVVFQLDVNTLVERNGHPLTVTNVVTDTAVKRSGNASAKFNDGFIAVGDTNFSWGTGEFTAEAWIYVTEYIPVNVIHAQGGAMTGGNGTLSFYVNAEGKLVSSTGGTGLLNSSGIVPKNKWVHVAHARAGSQIRLWIDGVLQGVTNNINWNFDHTGATIGSNTYRFRGNMDSFRLTRGMCRYPEGDFTPPTSFPAN